MVSKDLTYDKVTINDAAMETFTYEDLIAMQLDRSAINRVVDEGPPLF